MHISLKDNVRSKNYENSGKLTEILIYCAKLQDRAIIKNSVLFVSIVGLCVYKNVNIYI